CMCLDCHIYGVAPKFRKPFLRDAQLRRRTSPEQIRRRSWNNEEVRTKLVERLFHLLSAQPPQLRVHNERLVPGTTNLICRKQQLQRIMRLLAAEVRRAFERPSRIN